MNLKNSQVFCKQTESHCIKGLQNA